jgi:hypothetical protein
VLLKGGGTESRESGSVSRGTFIFGGREFGVISLLACAMLALLTICKCVLLSKPWLEDSAGRAVLPLECVESHDRCLNGCTIYYSILPKHTYRTKHPSEP